jgi:hypothetical protein
MFKHVDMYAKFIFIELLSNASIAIRVLLRSRVKK